MLAPKLKKFFLKIPVRLFTALWYFYKSTLSLLLGPRCRFYPSCSDYAKEAIDQFGIIKGTRLAVFRLLKCHPFHPGGVDPVLKNHPNHGENENVSCKGDPSKRKEGRGF